MCVFYLQEKCSHTVTTVEPNALFFLRTEPRA